MPFGRWGEIFSDDIVAAAMIDRLAHHAEVITLTGDSYSTRSRRELLARVSPGRDQIDQKPTSGSIFDRRQGSRFTRR
jgi:hypothetical protein